MTVDVIAGTSAGGLNGALLATAIARQAELPALRGLWRDSASLSPERLLRRDTVDPLGSVLDGRYFAKQIAETFAAIPQADARGDGDRPQVTLFVTATALERQTRTFHDGAGSPIVVPDHRQLYRFRQRSIQHYDPTALRPDDVTASAAMSAAFKEDDRSDFHGPGSTRRLALAARASASFPAAFEPVASAKGDIDLDDVLARGGKSVHLMDGGVLDNAPFEPVLDEIVRRPIDGPWKRLLVYVVPSGETADAVADHATSPDWVDTVLAAIRMPPEANLRSGLEQLTARQRTADRSVHTADRLLQVLLAGGAEAERLTSAAADLLPLYRVSQVHGSIMDALTLWDGEDAAPRIDHERLSTVAPRDDLEWVPPDGPIAWSPECWRWGTAAAERSLRLLLRSAAGADRPELARAASAVSDGVRRIEAVRDAVEAGIRELAPQRPERWSGGSVMRIIDDAIATNRVSQVCGHVVAEAAAAYRRQLPESAPPVAEIVRYCLVAEVLMHALTSRPFERPAGFDFLRLGPDADSPLVDPVRIGDDPAAVPLGPWKLWGTQLGHFAAFGRPEWRMHDWLWGRLDAASHLAAAVAQASGSDLADDDVRDLHSAVVAAEAAYAEEEPAVTGDRLNEDTAALAGVTARDVIERFRRTDVEDTAARILRAVLLTLRHRGRHALVGRFGDWINTAVADKVAAELRDTWSEDVVRLFGVKWRRSVWRIVRGHESKPG